MSSLSLIVALLFLLTVNASAEVAYVAPDFQVSVPQVPGKVEFQNRPLPVPMISCAADAVTIQAHGGTLANRHSTLARAMDAKIELQLVDDFDQQIADYVHGHTPFLRGSIGQIILAADALQGFGPDFEPVVFLLVSWSNGADGLVARNATSLADLKDRPIAVQRKGRHLDLLPEILARGNFRPRHLELRFLQESTFHAAAAMDGRCHDPVNAWIQDLTLAAATGLQRDFAKAQLTPIFTTHDSPRALADVYAVRADFLADYRDIVEGFASAQAQEQETFSQDLRSGSGFEKTARTMAGIFLNREEEDAAFSEWALHLEFPGRSGNRRFLTSQDSDGFQQRSRAILEFLKKSGLIQNNPDLRQVNLVFADPG